MVFSGARAGVSEELGGPFLELLKLVENMRFATIASNDLKPQPEIKTYFERFYSISDNPNAHDDYAQSFTDDATLIMASKKATGQGGRKSENLNKRAN